MILVSLRSLWVISGRSMEWAFAAPRNQQFC